MQIGLGWLGLAVGLAGCVIAYLLSRADVGTEESGAEPISPWPVVSLVAVITIVFWALGMQRRQPFSPGQSMAIGFLIGGLCGTAAAFLATTLKLSTTRARQMGVLSMCFLGLFATSLACVVFHGCPEWAILGVGAGGLMTAVIGLALKRESVLTGVFGTFTLSTSAAIIFAINHFDRPGQRTWWAVPILIAASVGLTAFVGVVIGAFGRFSENPGRSASFSALVSSLLVLGLGAIYAWKIVGQWQLFGVIAAGIGVAAIAAWVALAATRADDDAGLTQAGAVSAVLAVALVVVAFKLWAGLGLAVGLLAAWVVLIPLLGLVEVGAAPAGANAVRGLLMFVTSALMFRLFIEFYRSDLRGVDLRIHYTFIGAILGVLMPRVVSSCRRGCAGPWCTAVGMGFLGLVAAAAPIALFLIWGIKAAMGLVFGLTAALALGYVESLRDVTKLRTETFLALAAQWSAIVFIGPLLEIELTRLWRIAILAVVFALAVVWVFISGMFSRRAAQ
jgi:hypothetical protein